MLKADTPDALKQCQPMFDKLVDPNSTGTLMAEMRDLSSRANNQDGIGIEDTDDLREENESSPNSRKAQQVPTELRAAIRSAFGEVPPSKIVLTSNTRISGFVHSTMTKHSGNSQVYFTPRLEVNSTPGFIHNIFTVPGMQGEYLAVRRLLPCRVEDPFSAFPVLGIQLYSNILDELEIISVDDVDAQFASCPMTWKKTENIAVVSLSRVCTLVRLISKWYADFVPRQTVDLP